MGNISTPKAEFEVTQKLVKQLLQDQFPELSQLTIFKIDEGWDNISYKLGQKYIIRIPKRKVAAELIKNEQKYLVEIQKRIPVNIPVPIHCGNKTAYYPWPWSIVPFFDGNTLNIDPLENKESLIIADCLKSLHIPIVSTVSINPEREYYLHEESEIVSSNLNYLKINTNYYFDELEKIWQKGLELQFNETKKWVHGDLHARNIIAKNGKLLAIIDWGDLSAGDPATDLACFWMLFDDPKVIDKALQLYGASQDQILRALAWAVFFGSFLIVNGLTDNPAHIDMGVKTLNSLKKYYLSR